MWMTLLLQVCSQPRRVEPQKNLWALTIPAQFASLAADPDLVSMFAIYGLLHLPCPTNGT